MSSTSPVATTSDPQIALAWLDVASTALARAQRAASLIPGDPLRYSTIEGLALGSIAVLDAVDDIRKATT